MGDPRPDPERPGIYIFNGPEEQQVWLEENFPENLKRQRQLSEAMPPEEVDYQTALKLAAYYDHQEKNMNIVKEAQRDAREYARAQMYYGEGDGVRRRLIENTVQSKADRSLDYHEAFMDELERQDMAEHAEKARKERRRKDAASAASKNAKAIASGNFQNAQSGVLVVVVAGYFLHQTGLDKKALEKGKSLYRSARVRYEARKLRKKHNVHNITTLRNDR